MRVGVGSTATLQSLPVNLDVVADCIVQPEGGVMHRFRISSIGLFMAIVAAGKAQAPEMVAVDATKVTRTFEQNPIGIDLNYLYDADGRRPLGTKRTLSDVLGEAKVKFLRYPGGEKAENFVWSVSSSGKLLTPGDPVPSPLQMRVLDRGLWSGTFDPVFDDKSAPTIPILDFDRFMVSSKASSCEPIIVLPLKYARELDKDHPAKRATLAELAASAAAWVKYANVTKKYGVKYWAVGNEIRYNMTISPEDYVKYIRMYAKEMRAQDPSIKIVAYVHAPKKDGYVKKLCQLGADVIDVLDIHNYPCWAWTEGYDNYRNTSPWLDQRDDVGEMVAAIRQFAPKMRLIMGEVNAIDYSGKWPNTNDLGHSLVLFDLIGQCISHPELDACIVWNSRYQFRGRYITEHASATVGNFLKNGGFEEGARGWSLKDPNLVGGTSAHSGTKSLQVGGPGEEDTYVSQEISIRTGALGSFSFWAKADSGAKWTAVGMNFLHADGKPFEDGKNISMQIKPSSDWRRYDRPFEAPEGTDRAVVWAYGIKGGPAVRVDDIVVNNATTANVINAFTNRNELSPTGRSMQLWGRFIQDQFLSTSETKNIRVWASRNSKSGDVYVWLLNKQTFPMSTILSFAGRKVSSAVERWVYRGTGPEDCSPTFTHAAEVRFGNGKVEVELDPTSITVLRLTQSAR